MDNSGTINLDESNFDREINSDKPVLVDFWAEWCGPCKLIAPLIEEIAREKAGSVKVGKVNVDENQSLSFKFNIRAIPTLLIFKNGQVRDQVTGMTSKKDLVMPVTWSRTCPFLKINSVGMARMLNLKDRLWFSSTFTLPTLTEPAFSRAISSISGAINLQGPHHSAQKSTRTGLSLLFTSRSKFDSVRVMAFSIMKYNSKSQ